MEVGHLGAQVCGQPSAPFLIELALQNVIISLSSLREQDLTERMNLLLIRIGCIEWVAQNDGQSSNHLLDQLCLSLGLKSAYW